MADFYVCPVGIYPSHIHIWYRSWSVIWIQCWQASTILSA